MPHAARLPAFSPCGLPGLSLLELCEHGAKLCDNTAACAALRHHVAHEPVDIAPSL